MAREPTPARGRHRCRAAAGPRPHPPHVPTRAAHPRRRRRCRHHPQAARGTDACCRLVSCRQLAPAAHSCVCLPAAVCPHPLASLCKHHAPQRPLPRPCTNRPTVFLPRSALPCTHLTPCTKGLPGSSLLLRQSARHCCAPAAGRQPAHCCNICAVCIECAVSVRSVRQVSRSKVCQGTASPLRWARHPGDRPHCCCSCWWWCCCCLPPDAPGTTQPCCTKKSCSLQGGQGGLGGRRGGQAASNRRVHRLVSRRPTANGNAHNLQSAATHCGSTWRSISLDQRAHRCMRPGRAGKLLRTCTTAHAAPMARVRTAACVPGLLGRAAAGSLGAAVGPGPPAASGQLP